MPLPDIPTAELRAPALPVESIADVPRTATVAAVFGDATDLESLQECQSLEKLWISRVNEKSCTALRSLRDLRQLVIHNYRGTNLEPLAPLVNLTSVAIAGSAKLKSLSGIEQLKHLRTLILFANCGYTNVAPLATMRQLETLCLEGGASKPLKLESLKPLQNMTSLVTLRLASIRVSDKSLHPLHTLIHLRKIFTADTFPQGERQALAKALPLACGEFLNSTVE